MNNQSKAKDGLQATGLTMGESTDEDDNMVELKQILDKFVAGKEEEEAEKRKGGTFFQSDKPPQETQRPKTAKMGNDHVPVGILESAHKSTQVK